ncbi:hypothetical protein Dsin_010817 [Dipteronia sinensis]|uniref:Uncharacterized protein n=1 Tax=Dipteronia sinensis TaxID=43782 RepID=A0AAE0EDF2_9ROSI|nr:hypothetical protein Dsin_010817 [Dipteronia sinensis]
MSFLQVPAFVSILKEKNQLVYIICNPWNGMIEHDGFCMMCSGDNNNWEELTKSLSNNDGSSEEREKLSFICSCAIDSVKSGGSVLIPIDRIGVLLQLLEQISIFLKSSGLELKNCWHIPT